MIKKLLLLLVGLALAALFWVNFARAAVTPNSAITCQTPTNAVVQFLQGTDTAGTYKTLVTAGANGSRINAVWETNNDPSATHLITCQIVRSAVKYGGVSIATLVSSGFTSANPAVDFLSPAVWPGLPVDSGGKPFLALASGDTLQCTYATALTASDVINIVASGCDF